MKIQKINLSKSALLVIIITILLACFGCLMVYSASMYQANYKYGDSCFFLKKQIFGVILGLCGLVFFAFFDYHKLSKLKWVIMGVTFVLLLLVFVPGIGVESYGAKRWVQLFGISIQPSEIAKFALVIFMASYLSENYNNIKLFKTLLPMLMVAGLLCILVIIEPSMSVTMCIAFVTFFMLIAGGMSKKHTLLLSCGAGICVPVLIAMEPYRLKRLFAFLDPWASPLKEGYQLIQSLYSLGDGGLFGVGLFNSRQKYMFLPFAESDFIFSIIGEELGLVGAIALLLIYLLLGIFLIKISLSSKDRFGTFLCVGICLVILVQTLLNVAVVTGSIPPTGLPLPFISSGGTSVAVFMAAIGISINVERQSRRCCG